MKKRISILKKVSRVFATFLMVPAIAFFAVSCSDDDDDNGSGGGNGGKDINEIIDLPTDPVSLTADNTTNTTTFTFTAQTTWEAAYADEASEWFTFSPDKGAAGDMTITVSAPYNEGAAKEGKIVIKHGTKRYEVTVKQVAGQPDLAQWNPQDLGAVDFAPDAYNSTEEMPVELTFTVTNKQDYATLEDAPFEIFTFYTDEDLHYVPTDSIVNWVEFRIAEDSPAAKEGKKITLTVKPHEEFTITNHETQNNHIQKLYSMADRFAYITIAPKGTKVEDIFSDGAIKDDYKGMAIRQVRYNLSHDGEEKMLGVGMPMVTDNFIVTDKNFKTFDLVFYELDKTTGHELPVQPEEPVSWFRANIDGNNVILDVDSGHMGAQCQMYFRAYRGEELPPLELRHLKGTNVSSMKFM